jgi:hypothetical protein
LYDYAFEILFILFNRAGIWRLTHFFLSVSIPDLWRIFQNFLPLFPPLRTFLVYQFEETNSLNNYGPFFLWCKSMQSARS